MATTVDHSGHAPAPVSMDLNAFLSPASFWLPDRLVDSAWLQHAPFGFWLIDALRPTRLVELGTHHGYSYLVFCQAVRRLDLSTRCFAVDTWAGDEHSGSYSDRVFQDLKAYHDAHFDDFSRLVRSPFDAAVDQFEDGSIDLLHIDGRHFYEDVKADYELWVPKLSDRGVVLFHDTNVRERDFGVWRLWADLAADHPHFEFVHGHGLGVLGYGSDLPESIRKFLGVMPAHRPAVRQTYFRLGLAIEDATVRSQVSHAVSAAPTRSAAPVQPIHIHVAAMAPRFLDVRTHLPLRELAKVPGVTVSLSEKKIELPPLPADQPKIIVLQRLGLRDEAQWRPFISSLVRRGWVVVAELDDHPDLIGAVHDVVITDAAWYLVRFAHAAQTSTPAMADAIRQHNPEVAVFPNAAFAAAPEAKAPRRDGRTKVFFGALNREHFSARIGAALSPYAVAHPELEFVVVHDRAFFDALGPANKTFSNALRYPDYLRAMGSCDIALMPLEGGPGERYKSDVKFIEASSLGLASICSPVVYGDTVRHGVDALVAETPEDWPGALATLHEKRGLRFDLARVAHKRILAERMFERQRDGRLKWYHDLWVRRLALTESLAARLPPVVAKAAE